MDVPHVDKPSVAKTDESKKPERVQPREAEPKKAEGGAAADSVTISSRAKLLQHLREKYDKLPEVRQDKVDDVKQRLEEGTIELSSEEIIQTILDGALFREA